MTSLVVLTVVDIVLLIAGLAFYLYWAGSLLNRIAANLEDSFESAAAILGHARLIGPGVGHINRTGGVVAGALPLLYGMAEEIVTDISPPAAAQPHVREAASESTARPGYEPTQPASGHRRSRLLELVGFAMEG